MKTEHPKNPKSPSWPTNLVKKWLNKKNAEFRSDFTREMLGGQERRKSCSDKDGRFTRRDLSGGWLIESTENLKLLNSDYISPSNSYVSASKSLRVFVGTWNVGGRAPHEGLNLNDWLLNTTSPVDLYILGFQEIVPLNAGNVLGTEDKGPANKWLHLIRQALNASSFPINPCVMPNNANVHDKPRVSFSDLLATDSEIEPVRWSTSTSSSVSSSSSSDEELTVPACQRGRYVLVASKQMVGVFLCVWVREELMRLITCVKVSCVGRGIMGYMGNKGSISISMTLQRTTFCFVCTHLASGEKDGDEVRRNSDVVEILKKTKFLQSRRFSRTAILSPETIIGHDKIIWLGDLNYRLTSNCIDTNELLEKNNWQALLEKDQLKNEQREGGVFAGWKEGMIYFPPTYKYIEDSDTYAARTVKSKEKQRTPAWCDRILWRGTGMNQMWYARGESRFSDHRPVHSLFSIQLDNHVNYICNKPPINRAQNLMSRTEKYSSNSIPTTTSANTTKAVFSSNGINESIEKSKQEDMSPVARTQSCLQASRF